MTRVILFHFYIKVYRTTFITIIIVIYIFNTTTTITNIPLFVCFPLIFFFFYIKYNLKHGQLEL